MAYTTINKGSLYMNPVIYTGSASSLAVTGVNFQPDMVWLKDRDNAFNHQLYDSVRTPTADSALVPNLTAAENDYNAFTSLDSDGFTLPGNVNGVNTNGTNYVSWNWKANGTASSNTDGSITSSVSANTDSGFSIVSYTGTGATATVGHGLGTTPKLFIVKERSEARNWPVITTAKDGSWDYLYLNLTDAIDNSPQSANSSVFNFTSSNEFNASGQTYIAYAFAEKKGFSKFGSYVGNGSTDGTFIYTGMKPSFIMVKSTGSGQGWNMFDNKRDPFNLVDEFLIANSSNAEATGGALNCDFLSNGFKLRGSDGGSNTSGSTYIYMAFAEHPFVGSDGTPVTAR